MRYLKVTGVFFSSIAAPNTPGKKGKLPDFPVIHGKVAALWLFKVMFPMELLHVIKRRAEDLLLGKSDDASGRAALEFIVKAPIGKDAFKIRKGIYSTNLNTKALLGSDQTRQTFETRTNIQFIYL